MLPIVVGPLLTCELVGADGPRILATSCASGLHGPSCRAILLLMPDILSTRCASTGYDLSGCELGSAQLTEVSGYVIELGRGQAARRRPPRGSWYDGPASPESLAGTALCSGADFLARFLAVGYGR